MLQRRFVFADFPRQTIRRATILLFLWLAFFGPRFSIAQVYDLPPIVQSSELHQPTTVDSSWQPTLRAVQPFPEDQNASPGHPETEPLNNKVSSTEVSASKNSDNPSKLTPEKRAKLKASAAKAHKPVFFDNDFSYLCDPDYDGYLLGDGLKRRPLPRGGWYDIGGQYRMRYHAERNFRGLGLTGVDDDFLLHRTRIYGDFHLSPHLRVYAEFIDAESNLESQTPRGVEVNRADMQNLFVDASFSGPRGTEVTARVGRQELLYGAQRAVSPLDWANTRRRFEGIRVMAKRENLKLDAFWTNPMRVDDSSFDAPNRDQEFMGLYSTYTGRKNQTLDTYFLRFLNGSGSNDFEFNTLGTRWQGNRGDFLWEFEGAYQFGDNTDGSAHVAGMATFGLGRKLSHRRGKPTLWAFYDWASGDDAQGAGNGFHHNFPLAHKYNGFMDLFGRRNLEDVNVQLTVHPTKRIKLLAWYHYFFLETQTDTPYNLVLTPFNAANAPGSTDLGHEIDLIAAITVSPRQQWVLGYSHFFAGDYYQTTAGVPFNGDADFFYSQWTVNF